MLGPPTTGALYTEEPAPLLKTVARFGCTREKWHTFTGNAEKGKLRVVLDRVVHSFFLGAKTRDSFNFTLQ